MTDEILRCPYCVFGDHFRPMSEKLKGWFLCTTCGHTANPGMAHYRCHCKKCHEMYLILLPTNGWDRTNGELQNSVASTAIPQVLRSHSGT
jgi:hypothetical protein